MLKKLKHNHFNFNTNNFFYLHKKFSLQKKFIYLYIIVEITKKILSLFICIFQKNLMASSQIESFLDDIATTLLFPKKMHIITSMDIDEDWYWYLLNENEAKQMPSKVANHITLIDLHKCGYMLLSTFNHLLTLRSFNNKWKKIVDNTLEWSAFQPANGTNLWEFQSIFTM